MSVDRKLEVLCDKAMRALEALEPERALRYADEALALSPDLLDALLVSADALCFLGQVDAAHERIEAAATRHPGDPAYLVAAGAFVVEEFADDPERMDQAVARLERAQQLAHRAGDATTEGEAAWQLGRALSVVGDLKGAVRSYERALELVPDEDDLLIEVAMAWFETLRFEDARRLLEQVAARDANDSRVHHYRGLIEERLGDPKQAEAHFLRARAIDPHEYPAPVRLTNEAFDKVVEDALARLPEEVRKHLANVAIMVEELPSVEDLQGDPPLSPLSLGLFRGHAVGEKSVFDPWTEIPPTISLFKRNLERYAEDRQSLLVEIETTLFHEVGHFVGWDEEDLYERGLD